MLPLYDFNTILALRLSRRFNRVILPGEISVVGFTTPAALGMSNVRTSIATVAYKGNQYQVAYDKRALDTVIDVFFSVSQNLLPTNVTTAEGVLAWANNKLNFNFTADMYTVSDPTNAFAITITASANNPIFTGSFVIYRGQSFALPTYSYPLQTDLNGVGLLRPALSASQFKFVTSSNKNWTTYVNGLYLDFGTIFRMDADHTFMFEVSVGNYTWAVPNVLWGNVLWSGQGGDLSGSIYNNWSSSSQRAVRLTGANGYAPATPVDTPTRYVIRRQSGVYKFWANGVLVWTVTPLTYASAGMGYRFFGDNQTANTQLLRNVSYWNYALDDVSLTNAMNFFV